MQKSSIVDVRLSSKYASGIGEHGLSFDNKETSLYKTRSFPLKISSVNATKSA